MCKACEGVGEGHICRAVFEYGILFKEIAKGLLLQEALPLLFPLVV